MAAVLGSATGGYGSCGSVYVADMSAACRKKGAPSPKYEPCALIDASWQKQRKVHLLVEINLYVSIDI